MLSWTGLNLVDWCDPHSHEVELLLQLSQKKEGASDITRDELWCKGHTKKNGEPPNSVVAECITKIKEHSNNQSSQGIVSLSEDGVAKTFGKERCGRIRGLGFGVTPSQFGVHIHNSKTVSALQNQITGLQNKVEELTNMFMTSMAGKGSHANSPLTLVPTPQSQHGSTGFPNDDTHNQQLPKKCKLLNWHRKVVAEGTLASVDPNALVHHVPLGVDNWKVFVDVPLEPQAPFWREIPEASTIQQALGTTVAWNKNFILVD